MIKDVHEAVELGAMAHVNRKRLGCESWIGCSAETGEGVNETIDKLLDQLLEAEMEAEVQGPAKTGVKVHEAIDKWLEHILETGVQGHAETGVLEQAPPASRAEQSQLSLS